MPTSIVHFVSEISILNIIQLAKVMQKNYNGHNPQLLSPVACLHFKKSPHQKKVLRSVL